MNKKTVLITGGSEGLGKEIARLIRDSYQVIILAKDGAKLEKTAKELQIDFIQADITDERQVAEAIEKIIDKHKKIDVLINNAGVWVQGPIDENDTKLLKDVIAVNTYGTILMTKYVASGMKARKGGQIINIISQAGIYPKAERSVYTASKWAITGFTKSLQEELSKYNIAVSGLYPGPIKTKLFEKVGVKKDMATFMKAGDVAKMVKVILDVPSGLFIPEIGIKPIQS